MAGKRTVRLPKVPTIVPWAAAVALLTLGLVTTLIDLAALPTQETARANTARQRFVVNAASGEVLLGTMPTGADAPQFDVGTPEDATPAGTPATAEAVPPATEPPPTETEPGDVQPSVMQPPAADADPLPAQTPMLRTSPYTHVLEEVPVRTKDSLVIAPAREVTETVDGLQLPKKGDKDVIPSQLYAQPFTRKPEQSLISFVVMDAGIDSQAIGLMMALPKEVTIAYSPYTRREAGYSEHLRAGGHEVWTMLPTMDANYPATDPGPLGIIGSMPPEEMVRRTQLVLAAIPGSVGLVLTPTETIVPQKGGILPVLKEIEKRGLLLLSTHPSRNIDQITNQPELAALVRRSDLVIDATANDAQIRSKLSGLLAAAKEKPGYVVLLTARPQSLQILHEWLKETPLPATLALAPLSAIYAGTLTETAEPVEEKRAGGHGAGEEKKAKPKPVKKQKVLPQDQYRKPAGEKDNGGGGH